MRAKTLLERAETLIRESGGCPMPVNRCECSPDACLLGDLVAALRKVEALVIDIGIFDDKLTNEFVKKIALAVKGP